MKKITLVVIFALLAVGLVVAQGTPTGNLNVVPQYDVLGAHNNGGRGCAGCHAPHSGGRGAGGVLFPTSANYVSNATYVNGSFNGYVFTSSSPTAAAAGTPLGDVALWGTDITPLYTGMPIIYQKGPHGNSQTSKAWITDLAAAGAAGFDDEVFAGIVTCLSCHDGNVSKGAMMSGQSYEQYYNELPSGTIANQTVPLYGSASNTPIPTLLGKDGGTLGDYSNDHPIGPQATIVGADRTYVADGMGLTIVNGSVTINPTGKYAAFVANYGYPALKGLSVPDDGNPDNLYLTCTTCHNQHSMLVYKAGAAGSASYRGAPIAGNSTYALQTYFFVKGPYNPGANYDGAHAPSTMQFCRQCHFSFSNESYGQNNIGTAF